MIASSESSFAIGSITLDSHRIQAVTPGILRSRDKVFADNGSTEDLTMVSNVLIPSLDQPTCSKAIIYARSNLNLEIIGSASSAFGYCTAILFSRLRGMKVTRPLLSRFMTSSNRLAVSSLSTTTWNRLVEGIS